MMNRDPRLPLMDPYTVTLPRGLGTRPQLDVEDLRHVSPFGKDARGFEGFDLSKTLIHIRRLIRMLGLSVLVVVLSPRFRPGEFVCC
jgi:hypothetical protein